MLASVRGTDCGRKLSVDTKSPAHLQIDALDHFWMRLQFSQMSEGDLIYEGMGMKVFVSEALPLGQGKVAFPFALVLGWQEGRQFHAGGL